MRSRLATPWLKDLSDIVAWTIMVMEDLQASVHFLARSEVYRSEKPYSLRYTGEELIPRTNIKLDKHDDIRIHDIRGREYEFSLEEHGFMVSKFESRMLYQDFSDPERIIAIYLHEIASHLKIMLGARHVQIYEHLVSYLQWSNLPLLSPT